MEPSLQTSMNSPKNRVKSYLLFFESSVVNEVLQDEISNLVEWLSALLI